MALVQSIPIFPGFWALLGVILLLGLFTGKGRRSAPASLRRTLRSIRRAPLTPQLVLNQSERKVHRELSHIVAESRAHTLLSQVSMGEFLRQDGQQTSRATWQTVFNAFNAKRVDFLIVDADWLPIFVIEYQGSGHFQGNARDRDAIKRAVCDRAGIAFIEVVSSGLSAAQARDLRQGLTQHSVLAAE
ncbi:DUF2726 domain-containing protein [Rhodobacteraceae bacterium N5(2021)]|uniref:DUF2726 domain-containing protein n=1 Tax=Gymnodinialimonas phycosphaerae TaxID=2841589 RepID=A0A975YHQ9_9RHOB|nr:DUF2726 domain-containing protein [Gymnodinialimonas phycosphaerae]MBY4893125.1 DUF2726 domain-containing protein [Gymnodinialimonas phycosphaerae]